MEKIFIRVILFTVFIAYWLIILFKFELLSSFTTKGLLLALGSMCIIVLYRIVSKENSAGEEGH